jgi:hypothetical protein
LRICRNFRSIKFEWKAVVPSPIHPSIHPAISHHHHVDDVNNGQPSMIEKQLE